MNIYLEIFGYIGKALVIVSMMMTSVVKLRIINMSGGLISLIYAVFCNAWPVVVLNVCLIIINFFQTVRQLRQPTQFTDLCVDATDPTVQHFLVYYGKEIEKNFPNSPLQVQEGCEIHMIYVGCEAVGLMVGTRCEEEYHIQLHYVIPHYREAFMEKLLLPRLMGLGICRITAPAGSSEHRKYMEKLGFAEHDGVLCKRF